ncbi:putative damage-inducible protein DinB [Pedobacter sp. CAN_A7]|uniref:DinB family protein n=1 Tax=Pedobacter sp. CAN_A7 TaxID=2787722 RepID=UPI0018C9567C
MYRNINDFVADWQYETAATVKVLERISNDTCAHNIHPDVRSLERLAWHLTQTLTEMGHRAGLFAADLLEQENKPVTMTELASVYENYAAQIAKAVHSKWTDSALAEKVEMYGEQWAKGTVLRVLISHQSHHRGQMTVIMRILGLPVPGIYGPSKEEWLEMGLEVPE